jgi:arylsulfatase A-like enzyme
MSNHLPLAIMWHEGIENPGRRVSDYVNFIDFAPTFLELAGVDPEVGGMQPVTGLSLTNIFYSTDTSQVDPRRDHVLIGKERHDVGRPHDHGYPIRGIVKDGFLYVRNYETDRWPAGNPETGYLNSDGSPTKTWILRHRRTQGESAYWDLAFGKRPAEELYNIGTDPECLNNLATTGSYTRVMEEMKAQMEKELLAQGDLRMQGRGSEYEAYPYMDKRTQHFYERYMAGEPVNAGWVEETDFESGTLN